MKKQSKRKLSFYGYIVVGLWDLLFGVIAGELMAFWQLPSAYRWRGYWAIGGEWILIIGAIFLGAYMAHSFMMQWIFGGEQHGKVRKVPQDPQRPYGDRDRVRGNVLREDVRPEIKSASRREAAARKSSRTA